MGIAAYFAAASAYNLKDMEGTGKYARFGVKDSEEQIRNYCFSLLIESVKKGEMETAADTAKHIAELQDLYKEFPEKEQIFNSIMDLYLSSAKYDEAIKLANERLAAFPESTLPNAYIGSIYMEKGQFQEAIKSFERIPEGDRNYLLALYNIGCCYNNIANDMNNELSDKNTNTISNENLAKVKAELAKSKDYLEKVWNIDPQFQRRKLVYLLYQVYYRLDMNDKADEMNKILESE